MENNKLIAEFMGWTPCDTNDSTMYANPQDQSDVWSTGEMRFDWSWDWLMPVADKCLSQSGGEWTDTHDALLSCNVQDVYESVVEFIKAIQR